MPPPLPGVRRIAVLRANGIGDYVFALPALDALRAAYPHAEIVVLGRAWHAAFLTPGRPGPVDHAIAIPPAPGIHGDGDHDPQQTELFFECMRAQPLDLALQLHGGGGNSNAWLTRLGATTTAGLQALGAPALDRTVPYLYWQHEALRYLEVVGLVGAQPVGYEPRLRVTDDDLAASRGVVGPGEEPYVVLAPGATDGRRRWPGEHFARVGDALAREGVRVVLAGGPDERGLVDAVAARMAEPAERVAGALSVGGLAGLLHRARLVVANDSGPLHLAAAVGAATVGIYWCGILPAAGPLSVARHRPLVSWRLRCPVCGTEGVEMACAHRVSFVADVPVDDVLEQTRDLLG